MADFDYKYFWDHDSKKKVYGGKYPKLNRGYYGNAEAGNKTEGLGSFNPDKREFVGSDSNEYTFSDNIHGIITITAKNFEEAVRKARAFGYRRSDYRAR